MVRGFAVFARGVIPIAGTKEMIGDLGGTVRCGGVQVDPGDIVVADTDGVVVVPHTRRDEVLTAARAKLAKEAGETLDDWEAAHRTRIDRALRDKGYDG